MKATHVRGSLHRLTTPNALAFLLENGFYLMLFIPTSNNPQQKQFFNAVFGPHIDAIQQIQPELVKNFKEMLTLELIIKSIFIGLAQTPYNRIAIFARIN